MFRCQNCGDAFDDNNLEKNMFCSENCKNDSPSINKSKDRDSKKKRDNDLHRQLKEERHQKCEVCDEHNSNLEAHHIIPVSYKDKLVRYENNILILCEKCHASIDENRKVKNLNDKESLRRCKMFLDEFFPASY
jgi:5-methylcytosine-specific restriction endonuclease McrA